MSLVRVVALDVFALCFAVLLASGDVASEHSTRRKKRTQMPNILPEVQSGVSL